MYESAAHYIYHLLQQIVAVETTYILLAVLVVMSVMVLDSLGTHAQNVRHQGGFSKDSNTLSVDGVKSLPVKNYVSDMQGLAGRPDALIVEHGHIIPVERKPTSNKVRDRYIAQLLVYMRLVEEFEGKRPPYGYLILGPSCRRIKIANTDERQAWLQKLIDEMHALLAGAEAKAAPHPRKCARCDVRDHCKFKILPKVENNSILSRRAV